MLDYFAFLKQSNSLGVPVPKIFDFTNFGGLMKFLQIANFLLQEFEMCSISISKQP